MEYLHNGFTVEICEGGFPLSTDSIALSGFVKLPRCASVLDLGSGCGTLGLLLCAQWSDCAVTGIELDENAHRTALQNIAANGLSDRLSSICGDLNNIHHLVPAGSFSCCVSNPPYFAAGPQSHLPLARREDSCSMEALFAAAHWALKYGGDFFLVHRPERLAQLCSCASRHHMEVKRLQLLHHRQNGPITLILAQCRKGGKPGVILEEAALQDEQGNPTSYYQELYHLQGD
jgi:tRNA1(Val) A37 N6-methylase TrmN6